MEHVFINMPFDQKRQNALVAYVATLSALGVAPHSVLELPSAGQTRLTRLKTLIGTCGASIHDLSCVTAGNGNFRTPRFNMPFELGLAVAAARRHRWFVFESVPHRIKQSLSDIDGHDVHIHDNDPEQIVKRVYSAFSRRNARSLTVVLAHYRGLQVFSKDLRKTYGTIFDRGAFLEMAFEALRRVQQLP
jgi:hypothetical protein